VEASSNLINWIDNLLVESFYPAAWSGAFWADFIASGARASDTNAELAFMK
jgi:hypothetical protein